MKAGVHPQWFNEASVVCVCGNSFSVGSTKEEIRVEVCYKCHPFFTGETRFVDTLGRVERFQKKVTHASQVVTKKKAKKEEKDEIDRQPKSLREMLLNIQKQQ